MTPWLVAAIATTLPCAAKSSNAMPSDGEIVCGLSLPPMRSGHASSVPVSPFVAMTAGWVKLTPGVRCIENGCINSRPASRTGARAAALWTGAWPAEHELTKTAAMTNASRARVGIRTYMMALPKEKLLASTIHQVAARIKAILARVCVFDFNERIFAGIGDAVLVCESHISSLPDIKSYVIAG